MKKLLAVSLLLITAACSNLPVDGLLASFDTIYAGFKQLTRALPRAERLALFCDNALRLYRLQ